MKVLLATVKTDCIHQKLQLRYLYEILKTSPAEPVIREYSMDDDEDEIFSGLLELNCSIVYFLCNMKNEEKIGRIAERYKKAVPSYIVIEGGMQVSFDTRNYMETHPEVDFVFRGDQEQIMYLFLKTVLAYDFDFESVPGLAYREGGDIVINKMKPSTKMEDLPFPYESFDFDPDEPVYYETTRGVPDTCGYSQFLPGQKVSSLSLNRVCRELRYFIVKKVDCVVFTEKWFNYDSRRAFRIWNYLINNDNGVTKYIFDINGDALDEETIALLSQARDGMFEFHVDVESTNAEPLDAAGRKANIYQLMYNVSKLIQYGNVRIDVYQRAGLPCETPELFARAFNKIYGLHADNMHIELLRLRKGTRLRAQADDYGYQYSSRPPYEVFSNDFMPAREMLRIKNTAQVLELFQHGFENSLEKIGEDLGMRPYEIFSKLGDHMREKRLFAKTGKPENLYRIMYSFAAEQYDLKDEMLELPALMDTIREDLELNEPENVVRKFDKKGWMIDGADR
jgi:radical SAM superfamily enzyme YgiQ (UPF0313 family)